MKAKVLLTGEIVDVYYVGQQGTESNDSYREIKYNGGSRLFPDYELEFFDEERIKNIQVHDEEKHWQDVRERAAIAAMQSIINSDTFRQAKVEAAIKLGESPLKEITQSAIKFADELVKQLKGE